LKSYLFKAEVEEYEEKTEDFISYAEEKFSEVIRGRNPISDVSEVFFPVQVQLLS
jgi:hypothetical protein